MPCGMTVEGQNTPPLSTIEAFSAGHPLISTIRLSIGRSLPWQESIHTSPLDSCSTNIQREYNAIITSKFFFSVPIFHYK